MHVDEVPFIVVDVETTGVKAGCDRVIELAAVKVRGGEVVGRFGRLINPERAVPGRITQITGITSAMVFDQPTAAEVLPGFLDFLGTGVFVAHNLPFDERFLNAELKRAGHAALENSTLCTLRLARRLLPGLKSKGLSSLIDFYGLRIANRHRAAGDAEATAAILGRFLSQLAFEHEIETLGEVLAFQRRRYQKIRRVPRHLRHIRRDILPTLPDRPGVYFMRDRRGAPLYIGKARRLRRRVRSYFTGVEGLEARRRKLVAKIRDVDWEETPSELDALLLESRLIKKHKPRFNRSGRRYRMRPFLRLDATERAPCVSWRPVPKDDGAEYFGPLAGRSQAEWVLELINRFYRLRECDDARFHEGRRCLYADLDRCTAPCEAGAAAESYSHEVARVRAFLVGEDRSLLARLEEKMQRAAERLDYEAAADYRDWRDRLARLLEKQHAVAVPVTEHHAVLVRTAAAQSQCIVVRFGRPVETIRVAHPLTDADRMRLRERLVYHFEDVSAPPDYTRRAVNEMRLLAQWRYRRRGEITPVRRPPEEDIETFVESVLAAAAGGVGEHA